MTDLRDLNDLFWSRDPAHDLLEEGGTYIIRVIGINDESNHVDAHSSAVSGIAEVGDPAHINQRFL